MRMLLLSALVFSSGCAGVAIQPGHRGLLYDPHDGGTKQEPLAPGYYSLPSCFLRSACARVDDYDVTFSTRKELIETTSSEGLAIHISVAVIFRPILTELYQLHMEIGPNYYEEVIGPEFRSATRGVFAQHSYLDLNKQNEKIEDEVEVDLRRRIHGKHVEIASVTMESIEYAPEIKQAIQSEQEALRRKSAAKAVAEADAEKARLAGEAQLKAKEQERKLAEEQAKVDSAQADARVNAAKADVLVAKAEAEATTIRAKAESESKKAETQGVTPLVVQMHAYDALGKLGGTGTTFLIGDFAHLPNFLFPSFVNPSMQSAAIASAPAPGSAPRKSATPAVLQQPDPADEAKRRADAKAAAAK
jgi:regulator of protease activity HflC (stomatin/prohibitin superfamily)